ncbi:MAG TPA: hypothetical protein VKA70_06090 [Blastocatellia bacterium]|nr:hypothetical protein [Blastocatellia bacterium]
MSRVIITPDGRTLGPRAVRLYRLTAPVKQPAPASQQPQRQQTQRQQTQPPVSQNQTVSQKQATPGPRPGLRPISGGQYYRLAEQSDSGAITPELANELGRFLDQFAQANGFTADKPLTLFFHPGTLGLHTSGRAVDIYGVGGRGIAQWAQAWSAAMRKAAAANPQERAKIAAEEKARNLGYKLYKALQAHGRWAQPQGYPVQLFGPWTRHEGPHKAISDRLLYLHRDHIHVAH